MIWLTREKNLSRYWNFFQGFLQKPLQIIKNISGILTKIRPRISSEIHLRITLQILHKIHQKCLNFKAFQKKKSFQESFGNFLHGFLKLLTGISSDISLPISPIFFEKFNASEIPPFPLSDSLRNSLNYTFEILLMDSFRKPFMDSQKSMNSVKKSSNFSIKF